MTGPMSGSDGRTKVLGLLSPAPFTAVMNSDVPHGTSCILELREREGFVDLMLDILLVNLML